MTASGGGDSMTACGGGDSVVTACGGGDSVTACGGGDSMTACGGGDSMTVYSTRQDLVAQCPREQGTIGWARRLCASSVPQVALSGGYVEVLGSRPAMSVQQHWGS